MLLQCESSLKQDNLNFHENSSWYTNDAFRYNRVSDRTLMKFSDTIWLVDERNNAAWLIVTVHCASKANYLYGQPKNTEDTYNRIWLTVTVDWALKANYLSGQWKNTDGTFLTVLCPRLLDPLLPF